MRCSLVQLLYANCRQNNTGQTGESTLKLDINVEPAWIQGYTGKGIVVAVVDDGESTTAEC